eukprot:2340722-Prymnesium_polylepis.2
MVNASETARRDSLMNPRPASSRPSQPYLTNQSLRGREGASAPGRRFIGNHRDGQFISSVENTGPETGRFPYVVGLRPSFVIPKDAQ